jgi:hypothetical protein
MSHTCTFALMWLAQQCDTSLPQPFCEQNSFLDTCSEHASCEHMLVVNKGGGTPCSLHASCQCIPLVEAIYSRDSMVYCFDPNDASLLHGTVQSRIRVSDKEILLARFCSTWRSAPPSGILENGARIQRRSKPFLLMESI